MNKIEKLLQELCPDGVEFKSLGDICEIKTWKWLTKNDLKKWWDFPVVSWWNEFMWYYHEYNREKNTVTIARAWSAWFVNFIEKNFWVNDKCFSVIPFKKEWIISKFLYYFLKSKEYEIVSLKSNWSVPTVNTKQISWLKIPIPPLAIQKEIVKILDKFTQLEAELEAELEARKQQYAFYREKLLDFWWEYCIKSRERERERE